MFLSNFILFILFVYGNVLDFWGKKVLFFIEFCDIIFVFFFIFIIVYKYKFFCNILCI